MIARLIYYHAPVMTHSEESWAKAVWESRREGPPCPQAHLAYMADLNALFDACRAPGTPIPAAIDCARRRRTWRRRMMRGRR